MGGRESGGMAKPTQVFFTNYGSYWRLSALLSDPLFGYEVTPLNVKYPAQTLGIEYIISFSGLHLNVMSHTHIVKLIAHWNYRSGVWVSRKISCWTRFSPADWRLLMLYQFFNLFIVYITLMTNATSRVGRLLNILYLVLINVYISVMLMVPVNTFLVFMALLVRPSPAVQSLTDGTKFCRSWDIMPLLQCILQSWGLVDDCFWAKQGLVPLWQAVEPSL